MAQVVHTSCPSCKKILRVPADWINKTLRCKNCGAMVQVKPAPGARSVVTPLPPTAPVQSAAQAPNDDGDASLSGTSVNMVPTVSDGIALASESSAPIIRPTAYGKPSRSFRLPALLIGILLLAAAAGGVYRYGPQFSRLESTPSGDRKANLPPRHVSLPPLNRARTNDLPTGGVFPRRVLAISVNNYLYANPVGYGSPHHNIHTLVQRIARVLHVQPSQIALLSDTSTPKSAGRPGHEKSKAGPGQFQFVASATPPLKPVIEKTLSAFLDTCRPQDRILVLFVGHCVEIGGEGYLVPLEGEPGIKETLLPLSWLYDQMARCKARQKVAILDTCRFDPSRGLERPGSGPMPAALDGLLQKPAPGVQNWSACVAGQYSFESDGSGIFLDKLYDALTPSTFKKIQEPEDPLPIETLAQVVNRSVAAETTSRMSALDGQKAVQTPRLTGQIAENGSPYDENEALPRPLAIPAPSLPSGGMAKRDEIRKILDEIDLPPIKLAHAQQTPLEIDRLLPFSTEVIERYRPDYHSLSEIERDAEKYRLRVQVIKTIQLLRATFDPEGPQGSLREYFQGNNNDKVKAEIFKEQMKPARILGELMERLEELRKAGEERDKEMSPRWQAHYDYVLAELLARTAYVSEYNLMLGKIRKDELPELRPSVQTGWRLASRDKMQSGKDIKDMAAESKKLFAKLIKDHPGTPWEILAKRESLTALGLDWQPSS
jgi:hypothetical protein